MTQHWEQQRERSTVAALYLMIGAALFFGRTLIRVVLWPVSFYFLLTSPSAVLASKHALRRMLPREPGWRDVLRHFYTFAACTVDRLYLLRERQQHFTIDIDRPADVAAVTSRNMGCLLLLAHMGSFEVLRMMSATQRKLPISILMDRKQGQMLVSLLERVNRDAALQVIDAAQRGPELVLQLKDALQAGRMVCIMADRARADERAFVVDFCGSQTRMPEGPWALAAALGAPVILGFGLYHGGRHYTAHFELFAERLDVERRQRAVQLHQHSQSYARRLEHYVRLAPYNWFNFYDYWTDGAHALPSSQITSGNKLSGDLSNHREK